jgi:hypothetical protein
MTPTRAVSGSARFYADAQALCVRHPKASSRKHCNDRSIRQAAAPSRFTQQIDATDSPRAHVPFLFARAPRLAA